jgi:hypothetical protein
VPAELEAEVIQSRPDSSSRHVQQQQQHVLQLREGGGRWAEAHLGAG